MQLLTRCPFCDGNLVVRWENPPFSRCTKCKLVIRNPLPSQTELDALYEASWSDPDENSYETGNMDAGLAVQYVRELLKSIGKSTGRDLRILDFGAGKGALMAALTQGGVDVYGVEPYGHHRLRNLGLKAYSALNDIPENISFNGVVSMDVVEHLWDPWETLQALFDRIQPGGWICISTPNPKGLNARLHGGQWREVQKIGHLVFFEEQSLASMLTKIGFLSPKPLRWNVRYEHGLLRHLTQKVLLAVGLQGAVRMIAFK